MLGAMMFGVSKKDLLSGAHRYPSHVTFYDWAPFPGFTLVPSITQVLDSCLARHALSPKAMFWINR